MNLSLHRMQFFREVNERGCLKKLNFVQKGPHVEQCINKQSYATLSSDISRFVISDTATEKLQFRWVTPMY